MNTSQISFSKLTTFKVACYVLFLALSLAYDSERLSFSIKFFLSSLYISSLLNPSLSKTWKLPFPFSAILVPYSTPTVVLFKVFYSLCLKPSISKTLLQNNDLPIYSLPNTAIFKFFLLSSPKNCKFSYSLSWGFCL